MQSGPGSVHLKVLQQYAQSFALIGLGIGQKYAGHGFMIQQILPGHIQRVRSVTLRHLGEET
jgi:hypothetical protein